jgi:hypothetical protein
MGGGKLMSKCPICMEDWANHPNQKAADHEEIIDARLKANTMLLSIEDVDSLLKELEYSFISYENVHAIEVIKRMIQFRDNNVANRVSKAT